MQMNNIISTDKKIYIMQNISSSMCFSPYDLYSHSLSFSLHIITGASPMLNKQKLKDYIPTRCTTSGSLHVHRGARERQVHRFPSERNNMVRSIQPPPIILPTLSFRNVLKKYESEKNYVCDEQTKSFEFCSLSFNYRHFLIPFLYLIMH